MKPRTYIRTIKPDFFFDEKILDWLDRSQRLFLVGLFCQADDEGRFYAEPRYLLGAIFPRDNDLDEEWVSETLETIYSIGIVELYQTPNDLDDDDGHNYGVFRNWEKHQIIRNPLPSTMPCPEGTYDHGSTAQLELIRFESSNSELDFSPKEKDKEKENSIVDKCWQVWREHFDGGRGRPYTLNPQRKQKLRDLYREQLKYYDDPIATFRRVCQYLAQHDFFGKKENKDKVLPESVFSSDGRREKHVKAALNWEPDAGTAEWVGSEAERIRNLGGGDG